MSNRVDSRSIAVNLLRSFVERIERLEEEKQSISDDIKAVYEEAKAQGFEPKIIRQVIKLRKMEENVRKEQEVLLDLYCEALGMNEGSDDDDDASDL